MIEINHYIGDKVMDAMKGVQIANEISKFQKLENDVREAVENNEYDDIEPALNKLGFGLLHKSEGTCVFLREDTEYMLALAEDAGWHLYELVTSGDY